MPSASATIALPRPESYAAVARAEGFHPDTLHRWRTRGRDADRKRLTSDGWLQTAKATGSKEGQHRAMRRRTVARSGEKWRARHSGSLLADFSLRECYSCRILL